MPRMDPYQKFAASVLLQLNQLQQEIAATHDGTVVSLDARPSPKQPDQCIANGEMTRETSEVTHMSLMSSPKLVQKACPEKTAEAMDLAREDSSGSDMVDPRDNSKSSSRPYVSENSSQGVKKPRTSVSSAQDSDAPVVVTRKRVSLAGSQLPEQFSGLTIEQALQKGLKKQRGSVFGAGLAVFTSEGSSKSGDGWARKLRNSFTAPKPAIDIAAEIAKTNSMDSVREEAATSSTTRITFAATSSIDEREQAESRKNRSFLKRQDSGPILTKGDFLIRKGRGVVQAKIHTFLEQGDSGPGAAAYGYFINGIIMVSILMTVFQSLKPPLLSAYAAAVMQTAIEVVFLSELITRFICIPDRWHFTRVVHNYIDILAVLPLILRAVVGFEHCGVECEDVDGEYESVISKILLAVVPVIRMLKLLRRFQKFLLLQHAFLDVAEALPVLGYTMSTMALTFSCLIYLVEPRSNIPTLPDAMWLTIVTMTTVGYGDSVPETTPGFIITAWLIISSALYMAMPLGIVGSAFNHVWKQRDCILLVRRTQDQMVQLGYTAIDIPCLFKLFDSDHDGELSRGDFVRMIESMHINLPSERVIELFDTFDSDGGGSIDAIEFIRHVFPMAFADLYGADFADQDEALASNTASNFNSTDTEDS